MGAIWLAVRAPELPDRANADTLFRMGLKASTPAYGVKTDVVTAHALFDLAARRGSLEAKVYLRELSDEMGPDQIDEARRVVRAWLRSA